MSSRIGDKRRACSLERREFSQHGGVQDEKMVVLPFIYKLLAAGFLPKWAGNAASVF